MEMNSIGVVKGSEHTNSIFSNWNCVCSPLYSDGVIRGYVDISFYKGLQIEFAIPFMQQIAENVTEKWMWSNPEMQLLRLEFSFEQFNLTAREKRWLKCGYVKKVHCVFLTSWELVKVQLEM